MSSKGTQHSRRSSSGGRCTDDPIRHGPGSLLQRLTFAPDLHLSISPTPNSCTCAVATESELESSKSESQLTKANIKAPLPLPRVDGQCEQVRESPVGTFRPDQFFLVYLRCHFVRFAGGEGELCVAKENPIGVSCTQTDSVFVQRLRFSRCREIVGGEWSRSQVELPA